MPISPDEAIAVQESLLVLLIGLLEEATDLAAKADAPARMEQIATLCADAQAVAGLASALDLRAS
jgi:hypothetical protein